MSHVIKSDKIYKGSIPSGNPIGYIKDKKIYNGYQVGTGKVLGYVKDELIYNGYQIGTGKVVGYVKNGKIYKGYAVGVGSILNVNSNIKSKLKNSEKYDLTLMVAVYHFLIQRIF
jgi:hypothetical protein|tara:strand:+ start:101 stop:445 length:345 start_codon:yes stop_codon:yes gene_type:complete